MKSATWTSTTMCGRKLKLSLFFFGALTCAVTTPVNKGGGEKAEQSLASGRDSKPRHDQDRSRKNHTIVDLVRRAKRSDDWGIQSYLGCFGPAGGKKSKSLLMEFVAESETMDPLWCAALCASKQYKLVGLQNAVECHCGNSLPRKLERADDDDCDHKCHGDPKQSCGGADLMAIMLLGNRHEKFKKSGEPEIGAGVIIGRQGDVEGNLGLPRFRHIEPDIGGSFSGNPCLVQPCVHGGTCTRDQASSSLGYKCHCREGYKGAQCETINPCVFEPCVNGATCHPVSLRLGSHHKTFHFYKCRCPLGYSGTHCESHVDGCASRPCGAGSSCVPLADGGFLCHCRQGYTGRLCTEKDPITNWCPGNFCHNDSTSTCVRTRSSYMCICKPGYQGETCDEKGNGTLMYFTKEELEDMEFHYVLPFLIAFVFTLSVVAIHCLRVRARKGIILKKYQERIDKGEQIEKVPPSFMNITKDLCLEFCCCRAQKTYESNIPKAKKGKSEKAPLLGKKKGIKAFKGKKGKKAKQAKEEEEETKTSETKSSRTEPTESSEVTTVSEDTKETAETPAEDVNKSDNFPSGRRSRLDSTSRTRSSRLHARRHRPSNSNVNYSRQRVAALLHPHAHRDPTIHRQPAPQPPPGSHPCPPPERSSLPCPGPLNTPYPYSRPSKVSHPFPRPSAAFQPFDQQSSQFQSHHSHVDARCPNRQPAPRADPSIHCVQASTSAPPPPVFVPVPVHQCRHASRTVPNVEGRQRDVTRRATARSSSSRRPSASRRQEIYVPAADNSDSDSPLSGSYHYRR